MPDKQHTEIPGCAECKQHKDSCFCVLTEEKLDSLSYEKTSDFYRKGQVIFYEGNHPRGLFCIFTGKVKLHKLGDEGKEQILRFCKAGDILGYRALLSGDLYSATATAIEDCQVCFIPKAHYLDLLKADQPLAAKMIQLLSQDLKTSERRMIDLLQKPVRNRVAEALTMLRDSFGFETDGRTLNVVITRREIGEIAGITTETTIRTLSDFKQEGLIGLDRKKISLLDERKLQDIAQIGD